MNRNNTAGTLQTLLTDRAHLRPGECGVVLRLKTFYLPPALRVGKLAHAFLLVGPCDGDCSTKTQVWDTVVLDEPVWQGQCCASLQNVVKDSSSCSGRMDLTQLRRGGGKSQCFDGSATVAPRQEPLALAGVGAYGTLSWDKLRSCHPTLTDCQTCTESTSCTHTSALFLAAQDVITHLAQGMTICLCASKIIPSLVMSLLNVPSTSFTPIFS